MYVVELKSGNLLTVGFKTRWFKAEADKLAAEHGGAARPVRKGDPRS